MPIYENSQFVYILELTSCAQQINTKPKIPYVNIRLNSVIESACFFFLISSLQNYNEYIE